MSDDRPTIVIERPVPEIFAFMRDIDNAPQFAPQMGEVDAHGPLNEGETFSERRSMLGFRGSARWTVTSLVPDRTLGYRMRYGPMTGDFVYHYEPVGPSSTRITQDVEFSLAGPLAIFAGMLTGEARKEEARELVRLKALLEGRRS